MCSLCRIEVENDPIRASVPKPISEWTAEELRSEHDAASYFANASYDRDTIVRAEKRIEEIEAEWDRRDAATASTVR